MASCLVMNNTMTTIALFPVVLAMNFEGCSKPTDSMSGNEVVPRQRIVVSGQITKDTVWESGKDYVVTDDLIVEAGATLTIQPDI